MGRIETLLKSLSLEEKVGQLAQLAPFFFIKDLKNEVAGPLSKLAIDERHVFLAGSVLGIGGPDEMIQVQKAYLAKSRHQIPLLFMADVIHGYKTIFPVPLAVASSWNPSLATLSSRVAATEAASSGIHVTFAPMADLSRDPRWGRVVEGYGEDPLLAYTFAKAMTEGFQGKSLKDDDAVAACVKHFAAYGAAEAGREYNTADMSRSTLLNYFIKGYQGAIDGGARMVMSSFNTFEAIPATANRYLLKDVLRDMLRFEGVVISDYDSSIETIEHRTARNQKEAAEKSFNAGLEIEMASASFLKYLKSLVEEKKVALKDLDLAVGRVLKLKEDLGLFENPFKGASIEKEQSLSLCKPHLEAALKVASESMVLLKNHSGILPLKKESRIALLGSHIDTGNLLGPWSWHGDRSKTESIKSAFQKFELFYTNPVEDLDQYPKDDIKKLKKSDVIVLCTGELESMSGEAHSRANPIMFKHQVDFIKQLKTLGVPIALVLFNGRPLVLTDVLPHVDALLEVFFLGSKAAEAIVNTLIGQTNPSGKLTFSYPRSVGQIPIYYNALNTGRPFNGDKKGYTSFYLDEDNAPLFPFGYGLSYSQFQYGKMSIPRTTFSAKAPLQVTVKVKNNGPYDGYEVVQCYLTHLHGEISLPNRQLVAFKKVFIKVGKVETITFTIGEKELRYVHPDGSLTSDVGSKKIAVGPNSVELKELTVEFVKG